MLIIFHVNDIFYHLSFFYIKKSQLSNTPSLVTLYLPTLPTFFLRFQSYEFIFKYIFHHCNISLGFTKTILININILITTQFPRLGIVYHVFGCKFAKTLSQHYERYVVPTPLVGEAKTRFWLPCISRLFYRKQRL
jgi:hypothetical protein